MPLERDQKLAKDKVLSWLAAPRGKQVFRIFGYAGTGKTYVVEDIIEDYDGEVLFATPTGKAAEVLTMSGCPASTVHSLIYIPVPPNLARYKELEARYEKAKPSEAASIKNEMSECTKLRWRINSNSDLVDADLLVLDEVSMLNDKVTRDLLSFGKPTLVLGDPGQLPPISGCGTLTQATPDVMFTEIHRQAKDNPIIMLSFKARMNLPLPRGSFGSSRVMEFYDVKERDFIEADQIVTGKNNTRRNINQAVRQSLGFSGQMPKVGEKVICLRNHKEIGIFNGSQGIVTRIVEEFGDSIRAEIDMESGISINTLMHRAHFQEYDTPGHVKSLPFNTMRYADEFDFGYAVTVYKAMGSQWKSNLVYDDNFLTWKPIDRARWLYTGITRAIEATTVVLGG